MKGHLTSQQVSDWRAGVTPASDILLLDDHLALCQECRDLLAVDLSPLAVRSLQAEFSSGHLTEAQLDDYARNRPLPADVMLHLDFCKLCHDDAAELKRFAAARHAPTSPPWLRPMAAALAICALGLSAGYALRTRAATSQGTQAAHVVMASEIPAPYRDEVNEAIHSGTLHIPELVAGLAASPVQLRSTDVKKSVFKVLSPLSTAVLEDTPVFRWTPVEGAAFTVSVYDEQFRLVARGISLSSAEWHPDQPLPRGVAYRWEVLAVKGKQVGLAPAPTDPEARFAVLSADAARRLSAARAAMPNAPLARAIVDANAGAVEDAKRDLAAAMGSSDPAERAAAEKLSSQLK